MGFIFSSRFKKQFKKLSKDTRNKTEKALKILALNEHDIILSNHKLNGIFKDYRSISILSDLRLVYRKVDLQTYYLLAIGSHSELYS
jgi:addiction module RelE/StbE family toxin